MQADYETKKKALFECLDSAEKQVLQGTGLLQPVQDYNSQPYRQQRKRNREEYVDKYKHKESLFKRPDLPIQKCLPGRRQPDHVVSSNLT